MTVFLDPDGRPFFGGTYFPSDDRQGMPGLRAGDGRGRRRVARPTRRAARAGRAAARRDRRDAHAIGADEAGPRRCPPTCSTHAVDAAQRAVRPALRRLRTRAEVPAGDDADVPPRRRRVRDPTPETLEMITVSLDAMAAGGMYDQVGGGFHRYSVDAYWLVPHFEKMLYDQALLATRVPARLARHRRAALPAHRRGDDRATCCATCATPTAASSPPRTPTPRASRASSTCGRSRSSTRCAATTPPR